LLSACGEPLDVGSDLIWSARHETGDLREWTTDPAAFPRASDAAEARVSDAHARSGRYALSLSRPPSDGEGGPAISHRVDLPKQAYYAAWLYLAEDYDLATYWAVLQFRSIDAVLGPDDDPNTSEIRLRKLPGGQLVLYVFQHDPNYLQPPLADPPALVPLRRWFQVEVFYRHTSDKTGAVRVWLDGRLVYDLGDRITGRGQPWFGLTSISADSGSTALRLFADDVTISHARATPDEQLER